MDSTIRSIIDRIWTNFWEGGVTNPLTVIEQITYLLFVKGRDDIEIAHEKNDVLLGIQSKKGERRGECFKNFREIGGGGGKLIL